MTQPPTLLKQLERQRFLHGIAYVQQSAGGPKILSTSELAHLNQILTGNHSGDPWRSDPVSISIPSGQVHHFNVISNPVPIARDVIGRAESMAGNGDVREAAVYLYTQLVLHHFFNDANRRTAALATQWLVQTYGGQLDALALDAYVLGDLRQSQGAAALATHLKSIIA